MKELGEQFGDYFGHILPGVQDRGPVGYLARSWGFVRGGSLYGINHIIF